MSVDTSLAAAASLRSMVCLATARSVLVGMAVVVTSVHAIDLQQAYEAAQANDAGIRASRAVAEAEREV